MSSTINNTQLMLDFSVQVDAFIDRIREITSTEEKPGTIQRKSDQAFLSTFDRYDVLADKCESKSTNISEIASGLKKSLLNLGGKAKSKAETTDGVKGQDNTTTLGRLATDFTRFDISLRETQGENLSDIQIRLLQGGQLTQNESLNIAFRSVSQALAKRLTDVTEKTDSSVDHRQVVVEARKMIESAIQKSKEFRRLTGSSMADDAGPTGVAFTSMKGKLMDTLKEAEEAMAAKHKGERE